MIDVGLYMASRSKMLNPVCTIKQIKEDVASRINCRVRVVHNLNRKQKPIEGVIVAAYNNIFAVQTEEDGLRSKKTYSYSELISNSISLEDLD